MKQQALQAINNLEGFVANLKQVHNHPYSTGINVERLLTDLEDYAKDLKNIIEKIEEFSLDMPIDAKPSENTSVEE